MALSSSIARRAALIFEASLDVPEQELDRWLASECADDSDLLAKVQNLLSLRQKASGLFAEESTLAATSPICFTDELVGETLGDFQIEGLLGSGGMGTVYRARQLSLKRTVALKVLSPQQQSAPALVRFRSEIEAAANLHHPNIVRVHATGSHGSTHYFAMELVEGPTLGAVIQHFQTHPVAELSTCPAVTQPLRSTRGASSTTVGNFEAALPKAQSPELAVPSIHPAVITTGLHLR